MSEKLYNEEGEQITLDEAIANSKQGSYRRKMIEKFGEDVFIKRAEAMRAKVMEKTTPEWRSERARKAALARFNKRKGKNGQK